MKGGIRQRAARGGAAALMMVLAGGGTAAAQHTPTAEDTAARTAQLVDTVALTLDEVVTRALRHNPQMIQAEGAVQLAGAGELSAIGAFLPSLNISSGAARSSTQRFDPNTNTMLTGSSDSYNAGVSSSIDIFTGGRRGAELNRVRAQTDAAEAALLEQRYAVIRNAKAAYFDVLRSSDLIRSAEARLTRAQQALEAAERRAQVGSATRSDVLRSRLEVTNARQALLQAKNQKRSAMAALGRVAGLDRPADARDHQTREPAELPFTDEQLLELAIAQAPAVISAAAAEEAAVAALRVSRAQYLPTLSGSGSYNLSNDAPSLNDMNGSWSMRLGLSFPVFNRFQREESVQRSSVQATVARYQLEDARRATRVNVERVLGNLETAREQIALAEEAHAVAEEDMRVQQERYRLGVSTTLEQVASQENLVAAEAALIAARYDYQLALADLEALIGREL